MVNQFPLNLTDVDITHELTIKRRDRSGRSRRVTGRHTGGRAPNRCLRQMIAGYAAPADHQILDPLWQQGAQEDIMRSLKMADLEDDTLQILQDNAR